MLEAVLWENPTYGISGGAAGNVAYGGTVNPPRNRKGGAGNPPPKGARASALPDIHAGVSPVTRIGDYSDVTVIDADGRRIPWPKASHIDDETMRELMREVVDRIYTFERRAEEPGFVDRIGPWMEAASRWDEPKLDAAFLPVKARET